MFVFLNNNNLNKTKSLHLSVGNSGANNKYGNEIYNIQVEDQIIIASTRTGFSVCKGTFIFFMFPLKIFNIFEVF